MKSFSLSASARSYPRFPYERIKNDILGRSYALSLVFVGETRARALNKQHRGKTYVPNVLSFPLHKEAGEIYITPVVAQREAKHHDMSPRAYACFLFIHGCLHLKGLPHGSRMEALERKYLRTYAPTRR